ncbi:MAG: guanylate kinase [Candidatus Omnitrophica bacterium]|nr:guanylate kinase [Candidatus Omnitrophota bacterium]
MSSRRPGKLFVISASSGTGKTTVAKELLKKDGNLVQSISYTTRPPRPHEKDGQDYHFVTKGEFLNTRAAGGFLEWANVFGRYYGTPKKEVEACLKAGRDVLLLIDVQGAKKVKKIRSDAVFIFLAPPSKKELRRRLEKRGTESAVEINKRLRVATKELKVLNQIYYDKRDKDHKFLCDYCIVNRDVERTRMALEGIFHAERNS